MTLFTAAFTNKMTLVLTSHVADKCGMPDQTP
jgi:hypothetical protein